VVTRDRSCYDERKVNRKALIWTGGTIAGIVTVSIYLHFALQVHPPFPFLDGAEVLRREEWMEGSRLKIGGNYLMAGPLPDAERRVMAALPDPPWIEGTSLTPIANPTPLSKLPDPKPSTRGTGKLKLHTVSFSNGDRFVTLLDHPQDGRVKVIIQEYRPPSILDHLRLWFEKTAR
jgi:hypothetical protein